MFYIITADFSKKFKNIKNLYIEESLYFDIQENFNTIFGNESETFYIQMFLKL